MATRRIRSGSNLSIQPINLAKLLRGLNNDRMGIRQSYLDDPTDELPSTLCRTSRPGSHINRTYELLDIVFLTICAVLSGAEGWKDIEKFGHKKFAWLRRFRHFDNGIPVDDTIASIIRALEPEKMTQCFTN